jgi:hypothetical protein
LDHIIVTEAGRAKHALLVQERPIAALEVDYLKSIRIPRIANDLYMLAAHQIVPVLVESDMGAWVATNDQLVIAGRKCIHLIATATGEMYENDLLHR